MDELEEKCCEPTNELQRGTIDRPIDDRPTVIREAYDGDDFDEGGTIAPDLRDFSIKKLNYGYIVTIGCHKFAIETKENLAKQISEYILDPQKKEEEWFSKKTL